MIKLGKVCVCFGGETFGILRVVKENKVLLGQRDVINACESVEFGVVLKQCVEKTAMKD